MEEGGREGKRKSRLFDRTQKGGSEEENGASGKGRDDASKYFYRSDIRIHKKT